MNNCKFEIYYDEYISGELEPELDIEFQNHLKLCSSCSQKLDEFYRLHRLLTGRRRPPVPVEIYQTYQKNLKTGLLINAPIQKFSSFWEKIFRTRSPLFRLAEIAVVIIVGIFIGIYIVTGEDEKKSPPILEPEFFARPISNVDMDYMSYYFSASEMVLLEMMNSDSGEEDMILSKDVAQKLLMKTFLVHQIALKINEPRILRFLSQMELILYEMSNIAPNENEQAIEYIRMIIEEARLLEQVQDLQKILKNSGSPGKLPG
jgi:hypothetical protein